MNPNVLSLMQILGKIAADGASYSNTNAQDAITAFTTAFQTETTALAGTQAPPLTFVNDGFAAATFAAALFNNPKVQVLIAELQQTEEDAVSDKFIALISDLISDYNDLKAAV